MKTLCLFGYLQSPPKHSTLRNALHLAAGYKSGLHILIDGYVRSIERSYLDVFGYKRKLQQNIQQDLSSVVTGLNDHINSILEEEELAVNVSIEVHQGTRWDSRLTEVIGEFGSDLLLIDYGAGSDIHPVFKRLASLPVSVLLMKNRRWKQKPMILSALDPLHSHDRPATLDKQIVSESLSISERLNTSFKIVHCCYVTSYLVKYSKQIYSIHSDDLKAFCIENNINYIQKFILEGNPELVLPEFSMKYGCDILIMGGYCRSAFSNYWLGSTTEAVVKARPSDVLLIRPS
ncbi:universal stress protein [Photobacterium sp. J15]|uniref:universal stress protein n=1 Tax=Photobacterium sp. J15 TaxID=265901 RepID=UPI0007E3FE1F|nr:universal stress protein [Photobacterium sp. J15]